MRTRRSRGSRAALSWRLGIAALLAAAAGAPAAAQEPWREYPSIEGYRYDTPDVPLLPAEVVVGRLMFPHTLDNTGALGSGSRRNWLDGGTAWTVDYPEGDRTFARLLGRLTRIDVRLLEQPVNLDSGDDVFHWPLLISGLVGAWDLTDKQAAKLREYLLRGGFLLCDSFYGNVEWDGFVLGMRRVFPDRNIVELPDTHPIFHAVYDLTDRPHIPTFQHLQNGGYRNGGDTPSWRAVLDDDERVMVLIAYNNDVADGWQRADDPRYPHESANLAITLGVNFAVYALSH